MTPEIPPTPQIDPVTAESESADADFAGEHTHPTVSDELPDGGQAGRVRTPSWPWRRLPGLPGGRRNR